MNEYGVVSSGAEMLNDFVLSSRANQRWQYSGIDSPDSCRNKKHFETYPYPIEYVYNSRGFRDQEWPASLKELKNSIWCVGDSFTVGLGSPIEHTWPYQLEQRTGVRCINISMDGASNNWISRKCLQIIKEINPRNLIIHWSYTHRRESSDQQQTDEDRRIDSTKTSSADDIKNIIKCIEQVELDNTSKVIHSFIPRFISQGDKKMFNYIITSSAKYVIPEFDIVDFARDGHHYDIKTARQFVDSIIKLL